MLKLSASPYIQSQDNVGGESIMTHTCTVSDKLPMSQSLENIGKLGPNWHIERLGDIVLVVEGE
jgi:hypothetical protein